MLFPRGKFFLSLWLFILTSLLQAHEVELFYAKQTEKNGFITIQFDVAYAIPELRNAPTTQQPKLKWLKEQSTEQHQALRKEAESYLRQYLNLYADEKLVDYTLTFPDFETSPHSFITLLNQGAYYRVQLKPKINTPKVITPKIILAKSPKLLVAQTLSGEIVYTTYHPPEENITPSRDSNILLIGFNHVIPDGLDHILFIIGICLTASSVSQLLWKSLIFTVSHATSMAFIISNTFPIYNYSISTYIEPIIALSIAFIAIEVFFKKTNNAYGYILIAIFGLIHGCGFAGSLGSSLQSLNTDDWIIPLSIANIGIELAQALLVIGTFTLPPLVSLGSFGSSRDCDHL